MESRNDPNALEKTEAYYQRSHLEKCCLISSILFLVLAALAAVVLIVVFVLKPKKPIFHLHAIQLDSLNGSSSVVSLLFSTHNPNKFGIKYSSSVLGVLHNNNSIGIIDFPSFYQPPHCWNLTVVMHAWIKKVNLTEFITEEIMQLPSHGNRIEIRILGVLRARMHIDNFSLPKIKIFIDCRIGMNFTDILPSKVQFLKANQALLLSRFPRYSRKCSLDLWM
ncbi:uncharacterized protein [Typha angustifolia]|uniref:uncharacterized protein n=1 Tax=Typha angustifolia TaxID=59011 RepID=UPI003C30395D